MAYAANIPAIISVIAIPTRIGGPSGFTDQAHQAAQPLRNLIIRGALPIRSDLTKARDRAVHQIRTNGAARIVTEPVPVQCAGNEVFQQHITAGDQATKNCSAALVAKVERQTALVAIDTEKIDTFTTLEWRSPGTCVVADARLFDFDHISAKVAEHHGTERTRKCAAQVEDAQSFERQGHMFPISADMAQFLAMSLVA